MFTSVASLNSLNLFSLPGSRAAPQRSRPPEQA